MASEEIEAEHTFGNTDDWGIYFVPRIIGDVLLPLHEREEMCPEELMYVCGWCGLNCEFCDPEFCNPTGCQECKIMMTEEEFSEHLKYHQNLKLLASSDD